MATSVPEGLRTALLPCFCRPPKKKVIDYFCLARCARQGHTKDMRGDRDTRRALRAQALAALPARYNPSLHLASTCGVALTLLGLGVFFVHAPRWYELAVVPAVIVFANFFEWFVHKNLLHKRKPWPLAELFDRHTPGHHAFYVEDDMQIDSVREFHFVLIPAVGVLGAVLTTVPLAVLLGVLLSANAGWLVLITVGLYMVGYELSHLSYHLPESSWIGRRTWVGILRRHHAKHHDPRVMQKANFNVTLPLFDWILGTRLPSTTTRPRVHAHNS